MFFSPSTIYANELRPSSLKLLKCLLCLSIRQHLRSAEADGNTAVRESVKTICTIIEANIQGKGEKTLNLTRFSCSSLDTAVI